MTDAKQQPTPRGDVLGGLIEKLEGAAEGSRELDRDLAWLLSPTEAEDAWWRARPSDDISAFMDKDAQKEYASMHMRVEAVTTSIDAVSALIERKLPGSEFDICIGRGGPRVKWFAPRSGHWEVFDAATPALAACIALLQALTPSNQGEENDHG